MSKPIQTDLEKTFAAPEAACPASALGRSYAPFDHHAMHAHLARARAEEPVFYAADLGYWVVTRYDDVFATLRDPERFSAANANTPIVPLCAEAVSILQAGNYQLEAVQVNCDPPRHTRIRASAQQAMSLKALLSLEDHIRELVRDAVDAFETNRIDLLQALTYELPARTIFKLLDIPEADARKIKDWSTNRFLLGYSRPTPELQIESADNLVKFWHYCTEMVQARMANPGDDYVSRLVALRGGDDAVLTVNEINSLAFGLMFAGHETTTSQTTNTLNALLSEPGLWAMLCEDPGLIPNAVEEGLRMYGAVVNWRRRANVDVEIAGVKIPKDSNLLISFTSANRDAAHFPDPDRFDPRRANARKHLTFGNGIHHCLGAPLARLEMRLMLEELTRRFPRMARVADRPVDYKASFAFRVPESLWVDLDATA